MRIISTLAVCAAVMGVAGCGIGVNMHANTANAATADADKVNLTAKSITVYDATGILLAAGGSAGNKYNAQQAARKQAIKDGKKVGDKYSYSYDVIPPAPGIWTSFTYAWGDGQTDDGRDVSYRLLDVRAQMGNWKLLGFKTSFLIGATWSEYSNLSSNNGDISDTEEVQYIGMPMGLAFSRRVGPKGTFTWRVAVDPIVGGLAAALGDAWQIAEGGAHLDYRIIKNINLFVDGYARRQAGVGEKYQWNEFVATAGVTFIFWEDKLKIFKPKK